MLCFLEAYFPGSHSNFSGGHFFSCISEDQLLWSIYFNCSILEVFPLWIYLVSPTSLGLLFIILDSPLMSGDVCTFKGPMKLTVELARSCLGDFQ